MKVKLIRYTQDLEKLIAASAKLCYSSATVDDIFDNLNDENTEKFLNMLMGMGHESPVEHATFTFAIEGVSRSLLAQLTRHRIASFTVKSQRYVKEGQFEFVTPPEIKAIPEAEEKYIKSMNDAQKYYNELADILFAKHYDTFINEGLDEKTAKIKPRRKLLRMQDMYFRILVQLSLL